jgi:acetyl esterase/lipase
MARRTLHLLTALALFGASLLTCVTAPTLPLWKVAIVSGEYGYMVAWGAFAVGLAGLADTSAKSSWKAVVLSLSVVGGLLFLKPVFQARQIAENLPERLTAAFGPVALATQPWSWGRAFGLSARQDGVKPESLVFSWPPGVVPLEMDLYRARAARPPPCVIVIHGGGWDGGDRHQFESFNQYLASRGYAVATIEYRLAPQHRFPAQRQDLLKAIEFLKQHADDFGIDGNRLVLFGRSAGGQIAESVAYDRPPAGIRGVIAFYAPADLNFAWKHTREADLLDSFKLMRQYVGGTPEEVQSSFDEASPYLKVKERTLPSLLAHGQLDGLVWRQQSVRLATRIRESNTPVYFLDLPWATHAFDYNLNGPGGQLSTFAIEWFLKAVCAPP